jgi:putative DNA primase/helicase
LPAGSFGDWRSGISETWSSKSAESLTPAESLAQRERFQTLAKARETERERVRAEAAAKAESIWARAARTDEAHPYLAAKGVRAHGIKQLGESLVVPLRRNVKLTSLQFIEPGGSKRFLTGGETAGAYFSIGKPDGGLVICEGYATGATIREATGRAVAVAFNAGNLLEVARAMRTKFPAAQIICPKRAPPRLKLERPASHPLSIERPTLKARTGTTLRAPKGLTP